MVRDELVLLKEMLPIWKKYVDGFVFMTDTCTDGTVQYLNEVKEQFNILEILEYYEDASTLRIETDNRQQLFDAARKYSNKIICLDADEYLDGIFTKTELENLLDENGDTVFHLKWVQYTSSNTVRVDGPWANNYTDRIGSYTKDCKFSHRQMHSTHLPVPATQRSISPELLFIAHLQWLDKNHVAIKQYFWKVTDYVNHAMYGISVTSPEAYDASVNNFKWEEEYVPHLLKIKSDVFESVTNSQNYRVNWIKDKTKEYNIPNLGDWGYNIRDSIPMYFCTAADDKHYHLLLNLIGSIHTHHFYDTEKILVYDLGMKEHQLNELRALKKVHIREIEKTNPQILDMINTSSNKLARGSFSWKPVVLKSALDECPYVLYADAGTTILAPINDLFNHIVQNGYILFDCGHSIKQMTTKYVIDNLHLMSDENIHILDDTTFGIDAGFQGVSRKIYEDYILPVYELTKDIRYFIDDMTCPGGYGYARQDQTLFSIFARKLNLSVEYHDNSEHECNLTIDGKKRKFHITHTPSLITPNTSIFRSRWNIQYSDYKFHAANIKRKYDASCITAVGKLSIYDKFIDSYFANIQEQDNYKRLEFIIVYSEWSNKFNAYTDHANIKFIKEDGQLGMYNAWNIGIEHATTEYITSWNIDDLRYPINTKIKHDLISRNIDIDLVYNLYVAATVSQLRDGIDLRTIPIQSYPDNYHLYTHEACMAGPDPLWRKSFHTFFGKFDYKNYSVIGDWEMWRRMAKNGMKMKLIPSTLCIYVMHDGTVSNRHSQSLEEQKKLIYNQYGYGNR
jgi:hypothetical protein